MYGANWGLVFLVINMIFAFTLIFLERRNPHATLAWLMVLIFLPYVGFVLYLIFSQNLTRSKFYKIDEEIDEMLRESINKHIDETQSDDYEFKKAGIRKYKDFIRFLQLNSDSPYIDTNKVEIFTDGKELFADIFEVINRAKKYINIQTFIYKNDDLGNKVIELLAKKAGEGIEVRLLYDGVGGYQVNKRMLRPLLEAGGQVGNFFPSGWNLVRSKPNYRNHRKVIIVDGSIGYIGGFNIGDEYLGETNRGYWRDTHLRIKGNSVLHLMWVFFLDWTSATKEKIDFTKYFDEENSDQGNNAMQIVTCGPDSANQEIKQGYLKMITSAKKSIYIQTPYFIPDDSILEALKIAALSGVDVRIMIPNKPDHMFVYWATLSYVGELMKHGIKPYIYENGFIHSKTIVVDNFISSVGTANFDIRSFKLNFEVNAFMYDKGIALKLVKEFNNDIKYSRELTIEEYKDRSWIQRIRESISRLFTPVL